MTGVPDGAKLDHGSADLAVVRDLRKTMEQYHAVLGWGRWNVFEYVPPSNHDARVDGEAAHYRLLGAARPPAATPVPRREGRRDLLDRGDVQDRRGGRGREAPLRGAR
jgi:hypothetical protein